jgi:hypothetical protein
VELWDSGTPDLFYALALAGAEVVPVFQRTLAAVCVTAIVHA